MLFGGKGETQGILSLKALTLWTILDQKRGMKFFRDVTKFLIFVLWTWFLAQKMRIELLNQVLKDLGQKNKIKKN